MKNRSSTRCATVINELYSIIAEDPFMVCIMRNISFTSSSVNVPAFSDPNTNSSICSKSVFISNKYASSISLSIFSSALSSLNNAPIWAQPNSAKNSLHIFIDKFKKKVSVGSSFLQIFF